MLSANLFANNQLINLCIFNFGIQWIIYVFSAWFKTEKVYDLTGSLTFITLVYISYEWSAKTIKQTLQVGMIMTWAFRLGFYLFLRILKTGGDRRFNKVKEKPGLFFIYWTVQGIWIMVTLLPSLKLMSAGWDYYFTNRDYVGYGLWLLGFFIEVIADYQKASFRNDPRNKGKFISTGLWAYSRHPNYFGEIMLWFGLYLTSSSVLKGWEMLLILCPIFDMLLITKFSGIPPLEKYGISKWGKDPKYHEYLKNTSALVPFLK